MDPVSAYRFCPRCGNEVRKTEEHLQCISCSFILYINPIPCNAVIIENKKQEVLLVKRKVEPRKGTWDLPGGFIKSGESFTESVKREISEELHVEIEITGIVGIYEDVYVFQNVANPTLGITVTAKILSGKMKPDDDISDYKFFPKENVLQQDLSFVGIRKGVEDYLNKKLK